MAAFVFTGPMEREPLLRKAVYLAATSMIIALCRQRLLAQFPFG